MSRTAYLKPGQWQDDLVNLCRRGLSDAQVARELGKRHPGLSFTRDVVFYHRKNLVEVNGGRLGEDCHSLTEARHNARRAYQVAKGFARLLPCHELTPRECDTLEVLIQAGQPLTRRQIAHRLGATWRALYARHRACALDRLLKRGLLRVRQGRVCTPV